MKLVLKKDTLVELTTEELAGLNGAAPVPWTPWCPFIIEMTEKISRAAC